jgi:hypothetical protein
VAVESAVVGTDTHHLKQEALSFREKQGHPNEFFLFQIVSLIDTARSIVGDSSFVICERSIFAQFSVVIMNTPTATLDTFPLLALATRLPMNKNSLSWDVEQHRAAEGGGQVSSIMKKADIQDFEVEDCVDFWAPNDATVFPDVNLCAVDDDEGQGVCGGDSGG